MNENKRLKLDLACTSAVLSVFALYINERNRGENFKWEEFPTIMKNYAYTITTKPTELKYAEILIVQLAINTLKQANLINNS